MQITCLSSSSTERVLGIISVTQGTAGGGRRYKERMSSTLAAVNLYLIPTPAQTAGSLLGDKDTKSPLSYLFWFESEGNLVYWGRGGTQKNLKHNCNIYRWKIARQMLTVVIFGWWHDDYFNILSIFLDFLYFLSNVSVSFIIKKSLPKNLLLYPSISYLERR